MASSRLMRMLLSPKYSVASCDDSQGSQCCSRSADLGAHDALLRLHAVCPSDMRVRRHMCVPYSCMDLPTAIAMLPLSDAVRHLLLLRSRPWQFRS
jgi:hypothetical protein